MKVKRMYQKPTLEWVEAECRRLIAAYRSHTILAFWASTLTMLSLVSCITEPELPAITDEGAWHVEESNMDTSVRPGDDFFMYINGGFWQKAEVDESKPDNNSWLFRELPQLMDERLHSISVPNLAKLKADAAKIKNDDEELLARMQETIAIVRQVATVEEAWKTLAELMLRGYFSPIHLNLFSREGRICAILTYHDEEEYREDFVSSNVMARRLLPSRQRDLSWHLTHDPATLTRVQPLHSAGTRGFDTDHWPMLRTIFETLGIPLDHAFILDADPDTDLDLDEQVTFLHKLQEYDLDRWRLFLELLVKSDDIILSKHTLDLVNNMSGTDMTYDQITDFVAEKYMAYDISRAFANAYVTDEMKTRTRAVCEQMRETFRQRIANSEWMSDATKQNVREKLDAMTFNVGSPDEWLDDGFADLTRCKTLYDDVLAIRSTYLRLQLRLVGMQTPSASFHLALLQDGDLTTVNAFYAPNFNCMNIYPTWMMEPYYDPNDNEAHNYAPYIVTGHEITHGFDNQGATFDKHGDLGDIWATDDDRKEFERRAKLLADCYSSLEVMPWALPGLYADGDYTLGENIADLGGFHLVYDTYVRHLRDAGFNGEQLLLQKRRFYEAYGWFWHGKYSAKFALRYINGDENGRGKNVHSLFRERVNGVVMNTDDFYSLFDVAATDQLYRPTSERVRIW